MELVKIQRENEVYSKIATDPSTMMEMAEYFTFDVQGAKFSPAFKSGKWDGKIRLLHSLTGRIYAGLDRYVEEFCRKRNYEVEYDGNFNEAEEFSVHEAREFIASLNIPEKFENWDHQIDAFVHCVRQRRALLLSPTASGKSLIVYLLTRYYNAKTLIIVPTTALVHQLASDFEEYGLAECNERPVHKIYQGQQKNTRKDITISTWQSIYEEPREFFDQFQVVIGDEAHLFKAKSLVSILTKLAACKYRFGVTGTLDGSKTHRLVLEGLYGPVYQVTTTTELIEKKLLADLKIKAIVLAHPDDPRQKLAKTPKYQEEMNYLVASESRNRFLKNLALSLDGNTLLLFQYVEKHGKKLYEAIAKEAGNRKVFFVHGGVAGEDRDKIRKIVGQYKDCIIVASFATFSTGINIPSLANIIFGSPSKARIRILQSIGRGLRKTSTKVSATLYDIADDLTWKKKKNFTLLHFMERVKTYSEEGFKIKYYKVALKG